MEKRMQHYESLLSQERKQELAKLKEGVITEAIEAINNQGKYSINIKCTGRGYYIKHFSFGIGYKVFVDDILEELSERLKAKVSCTEYDLERERTTVVEIKKAT